MIAPLECNGERWLKACGDIIDVLLDTVDWRNPESAVCISYTLLPHVAAHNASRIADRYELFGWNVRWGVDSMTFTFSGVKNL
jgi:hypothetical protein